MPGNLRLADTAEHPPWPVATAGWILRWSLAQVVGLVDGLYAMTGIAWARPTAPVQAVLSITGHTCSGIVSISGRLTSMRGP
jgi:hypothetical protein